MTPLGGSVSSQPLSATLSQGCSLLVPQNVERSPFPSILSIFSTPVSKQHDLCPESHPALPSLPAGSPSTGLGMSLWSLGREPKSETRQFFPPMPLSPPQGCSLLSCLHPRLSQNHPSPSGWSAPNQVSCPLRSIRPRCLFMVGTAGLRLTAWPRSGHTYLTVRSLSVGLSAFPVRLWVLQV